MRKLITAPFTDGIDRPFDKEGVAIINLGENATEEALVTEETRLVQEWEALQYQRDRQYPSIGDQLDMQYHDQIDGTTTWKDAVAKVKSDNPKE